MNLNSKELILDVLQECIQSRKDLSSFCEDFCFYYTQLDEGETKTICSALFKKATDFLMQDVSLAITPETIAQASSLFETIRSTYSQLIKA